MTDVLVGHAMLDQSAESVSFSSVSVNFESIAETARNRLTHYFTRQTYK